MSPHEWLPIGAVFYVLFIQMHVPWKSFNVIKAIADIYPPQIVLTSHQDDGSVGAELEDLLVPECSAVLQRLQPCNVVTEQDHITPADILTICMHTKCSFHFSYFS